MEDIVARVRAEEADLVRKLEAVRQFLAAYGGEAVAPLPEKPQKPARKAESRVDKFGSYGAAIVDAVVEMLPGPEGAPVMTRELVAKLDFQGIEVRGENKVNALSALLARSSKLMGHGRRGWTRVTGPDLSEFEEMIGRPSPKENEPTSASAVGPDADRPSGTNTVSITSSTPSWPRITGG